MAKWPMEKGADVQARDQGEWTPLHRAAWSEQETIVQLLCCKGQDTANITDGHGFIMPLHCAAENGQEQVVKSLVNEGKANMDALDMDDEAPLSSAAGTDQANVVEFLLGKSPDWEARTWRGRTLLQVAVLIWQQEAVADLLSRTGVKDNSKKEVRETALG
ncbi:ankyrin [Colletotrichum caudatum]|nr:ankyrin [Colletotrichum caudatum]